MLNNLGYSRWDFHVHTSESRRVTDTPEQIIELAKKRGLEGISITDHFSIGNLKEASRLAKEEGIKVVNGIELSIVYDFSSHSYGRLVGFHILGYDFNPENEGLNRYLYEVKRGIKHYERIKPLSLQKASELIRSAGGVIVIAHPDWSDHDLNPRSINQMTKYIDGIECFHPWNVCPETFVNISRDLGKIITGGSDHHGKFPEGRMGEEYVPDYVAETLIKDLKLI